MRVVTNGTGLALGAAAEGQGGLADLSSAGFDQLSRWFIGMLRTRREWETSSAARDRFDALALALDQVAAAAHEPIETRRRLALGGKVAYFYDSIDQACLRGPLKWRPPSKRYAVLPRLLTPLALVDYARRLGIVAKAPVSYQTIADEIGALVSPSIKLKSLVPHVPVMTIAAVTGDIVVEGALRIVGYVDGNIRCTSLDVAIGATVSGTIVAESVTVLGSVYGTIFADSLTLGTGCHVEGDLFHGALVVEADTYFEGKSRRHTNPILMVPVGWPLHDRAPVRHENRATPPLVQTSERLQALAS